MARVTRRGRRFGDELERIGWRGEEPVGARKMQAFFELHIEQGPILEAEGKDIGVVTHGQGLWWLQVTLTGQDAHTGSTPMPMRRNAGLGMARVTGAGRSEIAMEPSAERGGRGGACRGLSELAQRDPRQGGVHGRYPRRPSRAKLDEMRAASCERAREDLRGAGPRDRDRAGGPFRPGDLRSGTA